MRAVVLERQGGPEALVVHELPSPTAGEGQVLVSVRAAGVNFLEVLVRQGMYPQPPELPWVPGLEVAGLTESGRRVLGLVRATGGGYAEVAAVDEDWLFDLPPDASFEEGAAFLMAFLTAWLPLTRQAPVRHGMRLLVTAAAGAVGSAAVQVGRALGAEVVAAAGSEEKLALPRSLGAVEAVTYDAIEELGQVDVVLDPVGGPLLAGALRLLRPLGAAVAVGYAGGPWEPVSPQQLVGRNVGLHGFYLGRLMQREPAIVRDAARDLLRLWAQGIVRPVVGSTYPLDQAGEAHRLIEERRSTGKVVLVL
ncbi:MAG: zinc-binding dehydrogenase [Thermoleophilia bacterium]|nr:zinc-binding dehydrogenase [Thermoleophilia bacterium]